MVMLCTGDQQALHCATDSTQLIEVHTALHQRHTSVGKANNLHYKGLCGGRQCRLTDTRSQNRTDKQDKIGLAHHETSRKGTNKQMLIQGHTRVQTGYRVQTGARARPKARGQAANANFFSLTDTFVSHFCPWQHLFQICGQFCGEEIPITMVANGWPQAL